MFVTIDYWVDYYTQAAMNSTTDLIASMIIELKHYNFFFNFFTILSSQTKRTAELWVELTYQCLPHLILELFNRAQVHIPEKESTNHSVNQLK